MGGYWNQAYYPSMRNAYMPAQHKEQQIPVPVFRMLGSDPIHQYDDALEKSRQGVITLEPVYPKAGGNAAWIEWFFKQLVQGPSMAFNYTQAGQENSFTWDAMANGLQMQFPLIEQLRDEKKIRVETLAASGLWFKKTFALTPATAFTALEDLPGSSKKTVWYNSRFYRANLLWDKGTLRFRDIHVFNEQLASRYEKVPVTSNDCVFFTLPVMDGYLWSKNDRYAGGWFKTIINGKQVKLEGGTPVVDDKQPDRLKIAWPLKNMDGVLYIEFTEQQIHIYIKGAQQRQWFISMEAADGIQLPFTTINQKKIEANFERFPYAIKTLNGHFEKGTDQEAFGMYPEHQKLVIYFDSGR